MINTDIGIEMYRKFMILLGFAQRQCKVSEKQDSIRSRAYIYSFQVILVRSVLLVYPRVCQDLLNCHSSILILLQHALYQRLTLITFRFPNWKIKTKWLVNYIISSLGPIGAAEGCLAGQQREEDHAKAPDVGLEVTRLV